MKKLLSVLIITKDNEDTIERTLKSLKNFAYETLIVDSNSKDTTVRIARKYTNKIIIKSFNDIGKQRAYGFKYLKGDWVLILDSDEVLSNKLKTEINKVIKNKLSEVSAYMIPYQNYFLNKPLNFGGENYRMMRLAKRLNLRIMPSILHNQFNVEKCKIGLLNNKIHHYSYRSITQVFKKFTEYAIKDFILKSNNNEKSSLKKIVLYPVHMFYARFIKDKGYKDGLFRIPLDLGFAYMEFLTYMLLALKKKK